MKQAMAPQKQGIKLRQVKVRSTVTPTDGFHGVEVLHAGDHLGAHLIAALANGGPDDRLHVLRCGAKRHLKGSHGGAGHIGDGTPPATVRHPATEGLWTIYPDRAAVRKEQHQRQPPFGGNQGIAVGIVGIAEPLLEVGEILCPG
jgi:hypothetical protein